LQRQRHAKEEARANQAVAALIAKAHAELSRQRFYEAESVLQTALATERATDLDEARALLTYTRREQTAELLRAAESTLANRQPAQALDLLQRYLRDPYAIERGRAANLKAQLELATSDDRAVALLQKLSHAELADFVQTGTLTDLGDITHPDVRAIYMDRLRCNLETELRRRQDEQARRVQSIRATPAFGELQDFAALARQRLRAQGKGGEIDYRLLTRLFRELDVTGVEEKERILAKLTARPLDFDEAAKIARMRANLKERFRTYKEFDLTDRQIFDWLVDQDTNILLQELQGSPLKP
jgi:hypothetical protein